MKTQQESAAKQFSYDIKQYEYVKLYGDLQHESMTHSHAMPVECF